MQSRLALPIKLSTGAIKPEAMRPGDAGLDLYSPIETVVHQGDVCVIDTGVSIALPDGYVGLVWDRGGLAVKFGITTLAGVVDSNYRGTIKVALTKITRGAYLIHEKDRIAQLLIQPVMPVHLHEVEDLGITERGEKWAGSSGF